MSIYSAIVRSK